jgi:ParB family chromosome partitioning protein
MKYTWIEIPVDTVTVSRPVRRDAGDLATLEASIRRLGVLQPLILDRRNRLIAGYRRLLAARRAGLGTVPALRVEADADSLLAADIQADENLCRLPLSHEDFEALIERKQGLVQQRKPGLWSEVVQWLKRLFPSFGRRAHGH